MMETARSKAETLSRTRLTPRTTAILLLLSSLVVGGVTAHKVFRSDAVNSSANLSFAQPPSCRLVLAPLAGDQKIDQDIAQQQTIIQSHSSRFTALERLGWLFVKKARLSFDPGFYKLAEQCAACIEAHDSKSAETLLLRAHALQSLHHFREAEDAARELVNLRQLPFDYGVLGDILIDQGKVHEGAAAYQKMVDLRPDLQSYARAAHIRWLTGDLNSAIELMNLAVSAGSPNDPEASAWAFTRLALYQLQRGATKRALDLCAGALSLQSDYAPALLARGRVLLALNRPAEAAAELRRAAELNPLPEYQWTLADALNVKGERSRAAEIESQLADGSTEDPRTLSLYLATRNHDVERAVILAQQELINRGDVFTLDALAWALAAAGRTAEAQQYIEKALSQRTADARLYLHAGVVAALNNDNTQARGWLDRAAATKQMLLPGEQTLLAAWRQKVGRKTRSTRQF